MTESNIRERTVEIADGYAAFTGRDDEWKEEVSVIDFVQFRKQAIAELSEHRIRNVNDVKVTPVTTKPPISIMEYQSKPSEPVGKTIDKVQAEIETFEDAEQSDATKEERELALLRSLKDD